jgi:hypothetical protein
MLHRCSRMGWAKSRSMLVVSYSNIKGFRDEAARSSSASSPIHLPSPTASPCASLPSSLLIFPNPASSLVQSDSSSARQARSYLLQSRRSSLADPVLFRSDLIQDKHIVGYDLQGTLTPPFLSRSEEGAEELTGLWSYRQSIL